MFHIEQTFSIEKMPGKFALCRQNWLYLSNFDTHKSSSQKVEVANKSFLKDPKKTIGINYEQLF
jgi:hypothetical protein